MFSYNIDYPKFISVLKVIFNFRKKVLDLNFLFRLIGCIEWGKFDPPKRVIPNWRGRDPQK